MHTHLLRRRFNRTVLSVAVGLTGCTLAASAWADRPSFSGPSMTRPSSPTAFSGQGFVPNSAVTVMVKSPSGAAAGYGAVTAANGSLSYTLVPTQQGAYTVSVTNSSGQVLATAVVAVLP